MDESQVREWAEREVERRHERPMRVDANQKGLTAAFLSLAGLGALGVVAGAYIPWWALGLTPVVVWFGVRQHHRDKSIQMRSEVAEMIRQRRIF